MVCRQKSVDSDCIFKNKLNSKESTGMLEGAPLENSEPSYCSRVGGRSKLPELTDKISS